jgi:hypothetical protein
MWNYDGSRNKSNKLYNNFFYPDRDLHLDLRRIQYVLIFFFLKIFYAHLIVFDKKETSKKTVMMTDSEIC